jgi:transposase
MEKELVVNNLKLSPKEQENLRFKIIRIAKKNLKPNGKPDVEKVAEICECSTRLIYETWRKHQNGGISAIKAKKMGRPANSGELTVEEQNEVQKNLIEKYPEQLKLSGCLWDRDNVRLLIKALFGVEITVQCVGKYLKKWGFTPQRPVKKNYKQQPEEVKKWLDETYPEIKECAKTENAEIHWGDEVGCQNVCNYAKGYSLKGQTPTLLFGDEKLRINMISSVTNQGKLRFMFYRNGFNAKVFLTFIKRLVKGANGRKIYLIVDNLRVHHAILVREWIQKNIDKIELFFLPPYCPEYNPDEYVNNNLKSEMSKLPCAKSVDELETNARSIVKTIQNDTSHVESFFNAKKIKYAK